MAVEVNKHFAIAGSNLDLKGAWLKQLVNGESGLPELKGKGVLFSEITLNKFIEEEYKHDKKFLPEQGERSLRTFSSGEQKKALLSYLLSTNPDFLILDNPFDAMDVTAVENFKNRFETISEEITIVQIFKRKADLLPFITDFLEVSGDFFSVIKPNIKANTALKEEFDITIPKPLKEYINIPEALVELKNVSVSYEDKPVLHEINWRINKGQFWQLKGPNGSGKTTILSMIYGNNTKGFGVDLFLFGNKKGSGETVWEIKEKIGFFTPTIIQLFKGSYNLQEMVISGLFDSIGLYQKPNDLHIKLADKWLQVLGLYNERFTNFFSCSTVEQRLVLIARAMIKHPPLLILDEPTTGLDDDGAHLIVSLINKIAQESKTAVLYVSHRDEAGLKPDYVYTLIPTANGSMGREEVKT